MASKVQTIKTSKPSSRSKVTSFTNTCSECLKEYWVNALTWGRATRGEYWWSFLFYQIIIPIVGFCTGILAPLTLLFMLVCIVPNFTVTARRLHDADLSNWNVLWCLIPYIGCIILLVLLCLGGDKKVNKYGKPRI